MSFRGDMQIASLWKMGFETTLAVFDDGIVLADPGRGTLGFVAAMGGGLISGLAGRRSVARRRAAIRNEETAVQAAAAVKGARLLGIEDIESVVIQPGLGQAQKLIFRPRRGKDLVYRFPAKHRNELVGLLGSLLGARLQDATD